MTLKILFNCLLGFALGAFSLRPDAARGDDKKKLKKFVTEMDFDSADIDGKVKAPSGFFLQGRNKQSLETMVQLRSDFRDQLRNSRAGVRAAAK